MVTIYDSGRGAKLVLAEYPEGVPAARPFDPERDLCDNALTNTENSDD